MNVQLSLGQHSEIPRIIHISWKHKSLLEKDHPLLDHGIKNLLRLNPDWEIQISDDPEVENYLKKHLSRYDYLKIANKKIVEKVDLWRLLKIYNQGGVYTDIDRLWNQKLDNIIRLGVKCVLPTYEDVDFSHSLMISTPRNPIFKQAIADNLRKRSWLNLRGVFHLGPPLYMRSVTKSLFGKSIKRRPGKKLMESMRKAIDLSADFQTFREIHPYHTFTFQGDLSGFDFEAAKKGFYRQSAVRSWDKGLDINSVIFFGILFLIITIVLICLL